MPRFYFDVICGAAFICDDYGHECRGIEAAKADAMSTAEELTRERLRTGQLQDIRVDVHDEQRRPVLSVTVLMTVERHPA